jgi:uncharacterized protein (TIGR03067 family)
MRRAALALMAAVALAAAAADEKDDANKKDLHALQGTWEVVSQTFGAKGEARLLEKPKPRTIEGTKLISQGETGNVVQMFTIDATKKPAEMDIQPPASYRGKATNAKGVVTAIYQLDRDTLTIANSLGLDLARPKGFDAMKEVGPVVVTIYRRVKK